jgi:hypothetical protein
MRISNSGGGDVIDFGPAQGKRVFPMLRLEEPDQILGERKA